MAKTNYELGYEQFFNDLGINKHAGQLKNVGKRLSTLFKSRKSPIVSQTQNVGNPILKPKPDYLRRRIEEHFQREARPQTRFVLKSELRKSKAMPQTKVQTKTTAVPKTKSPAEQSAEVFERGFQESGHATSPYKMSRSGKATMIGGGVLAGGAGVLGLREAMQEDALPGGWQESRGQGMLSPQMYPQYQQYASHPSEYYQAY